ncbi:MAG: OmpA family protein [Muribaculaceae bacterium]|nr:OmpA family protein [Muribaculaceae bacterium]
MNKKLTVLALAAVALSASAQEAIKTPGIGDNWSVGINAGVTTPMKHAAFWGDMRAIVGLNVAKQISPIFGAGIEGEFSINTGRVNGIYAPNYSKTAFDASYVGVYGKANLFNLFGGFKCEKRSFDMDAVLGIGWLHQYKNGIGDLNDFGTKVGLNFNYNITQNWTLSFQPSIIWNLTARSTYDTGRNGFNINYANYNLTAGIAYTFGKGFQCVQPYNQAEVDALNAAINDLRLATEAQAVEIAGLQTANAALAADLAACQNRKPEVVKEVTNNLNSVRYIFFKIGSSVITADQQPNVEMIAAYMKNHPNSKVIIKGYASPDGPEEVNIRLANQRAQSVKDALIKKYKIASNRIVAEGEGIGNMFEEESWNRVSICTLEESK